MAGALTKQDVLDTLSDPALYRIVMWAEGLWITGASFHVVRQAIEDGKIAVEEGTQTIALYYAKQNKIVTQLSGSPPDVHAKALLLHECTHALFDVFKFKISTITEEVLCYIVQHAYIHIKQPTYSGGVNTSLDHVSQDYLWQTFYRDVLDYGKRVAAGHGAIDTTGWEFKSLRNHLWTLNIYQHLEQSTMGVADGV
jgi:hypothetical protein